MTKKPILWVFLAVLSLASAAFSWRYFTRAFPLLSLDIRMDRQAALAGARALASEGQLGPSDFRDAASFSLDDTVQTFVELEGGGKPAFSSLVGDRLYAPYHWRVRHFKEREKNETTFSFAPDGTSNGFLERLKEDAPGAALTTPAARDIAETAATHAWAVDLAPFALVEHSQEQRIGGRVDHTFVYERSDRGLGEGRYRLRLVVSGDKLTELTYFLKIPDAFKRRYDQMRSANTAIGVGGSLALVVLYVVGGIGVGLFFLTRERWVIWRQPVLWGSIVALAQTAAAVNEWPLTWMQYDTALSTRSFVAQQISFALAELAVNVVVFSLSFMAAESLTRRAFPSHPQFWRLWGHETGGSRAVLGRTAAGYLLVPIFVAYEVGLYFFATKSFGWWTPSEALFNPDILAAYAPWLSAIAKSFQAGFWEESLFRAVPIAGAALIGDRLGNRRLWIVLAFVVQVIVFGAGHAPYPTQPAYARPVELVLPSIGFGLLYLTFGLLPGIVLHFAFDAFFFAMPLFATTAAGIRVQQVAVIAAICVPLWVALARRVQARRAVDLPAAALNGAWRPEPQAAIEATPQTVPSRAGLTLMYVRAVLAVGAIAAVAWAALSIVRPLQRFPIAATRSEASSTARRALERAHLGAGWRFLPVADEGGGLAHRFVWTTAGRSTYSSLLGTYLHLPGWTVFVRTFEGDVAERAEAWTVHLDSTGVVHRVAHELPEERPGLALDEGAARLLARRSLTERFGIEPTSLKEVSAELSKLPQRSDWTLTFTDSSRSLPRGEPRLSVRIAGNEVADVSRFVFIPDDWERIARNAQTVASVVQVSGSLLAAVMILSGVIAAIVSWSRRQFAVRLFLVAFAVFVVLAAIRFVNGFPTLMANLSTSQPLQLQLLVLIGSSVVGLTLLSTAMALVSGAVPVWSQSERLEPRTAVQVGLALGAIGAAARMATAAAGTSGPTWPSYASASSYVPILAAATNPIGTLMTRIVFLLLLVSGADRLTAGWTRRRALIGVLLLIAGGMLGSAGSPQNLALWLAFAALVGALMVAAYVTVLRHDASVVPVAAAVMTMAGTVYEGSSGAYPGAFAGTTVAVITMAAVAYGWFHALRAPRVMKAAKKGVV